MRQTIPHLLLALSTLLPLGCNQASGDPPSQVKYLFTLSGDEIALARTVAEIDLPDAALPSGPRTAFIKVDLLPDSQAETAQRLVMVHHYCYQTDETIFTMVDLHSHEILKREIKAHYPTALAPAEIEHAYHLVRIDARIQPLLEVIPTTFDARPIQFAAAQEPLFGHRVVHVLLRQGGNYLVNPRVLVDLTTESVHLETSPAAPTE